jgi:ribosome modulation factor
VAKIPPEDLTLCAVLLAPQYVRQCPAPRGHGPDGIMCAQHAAAVPSPEQIDAAVRGHEAYNRGANRDDCPYSFTDQHDLWRRWQRSYRLTGETERAAGRLH